MAGGYDLVGFFAVAGLVVEKYVGAEGFQNCGFFQATEEERLIQADIPLAQGANHPLMGRRRACGYQRCANRALLFGKLLLQAVQGGEEGFEWTAAEQLAGRLPLMALKGFQAGLLIDPLRLIGKQHGVTVESNTQLVTCRSPCAAGEDGRRTETGPQRAAHIFGVSGEKQVAAKCGQIRVGAAPADKGRTRDT